MRKWLIPLTLTLVAGLFLVGLLVSGPAPNAAAGTVAQVYFELVQPGAGGRLTPMIGGIPPAGSPWHELYPVFCTMTVQEGYTDNGDGVISACDIIRLSGVDYHIVAAGPTYWVTCERPGLPPVTVAYEPTNPNPSGNPICETWHEVYPNFCQQIHIDDWQDNGDGVLSPCDVFFHNDPTGGPTTYHLDRIECDITVVPVSVPTEKSTWGKIKGLIDDLIH